MRERWLANERSFGDRFPAAKSIIITYSQEGDGVNDARYPRSISVPLDPSLCCDNPRCKRGGIYLGNYVSEMVRQRTSHQRLELPCIGDEGSPKGVRKGALCCNHFSIEIAITFHPELPNSADLPEHA
jgi:hypothetical protein